MTSQTVKEKGSTGMREKKEERKPLPRPASLRFTPTAWAKLLFLRDRGPTEIGGFGIAAEDDLLLIEDVITVRQVATAATIAFDDEAVADFFEDQVDRGHRPERFGRVWLHSHPFDSPTPSRTDEECFARVFGGCQWAVMFVVAETGKTYARLRFNVGPGGETVLPVAVDFSRPFPASDPEAWEAEYRANIRPGVSAGLFGSGMAGLFGDEAEGFFRDEEDDVTGRGHQRLIDVLDLDPEDREVLLHHLARARDPEEAEEMLHDYYGEV